MDVIDLYFADTLLQHYIFDEQPLEVGADRGCDIVVPGVDMPPRALQVKRRHGSVFVERYATADSKHWPLGEALPVGQHYRLVRRGAGRSLGLDAQGPVDAKGDTQSLSHGLDDFGRYVLVVECGAEMRRFPVDRPLRLGHDPQCDVVLLDRTVSRFHCRVEPVAMGEGRGALRLRDLSSRNGTWLGATRVEAADLRLGAIFRIGRTAVRVERAGPKLDGAWVAASEASQRVVAEAQRYAQFEFPVLVCGETGVGKEGVARMLHALGNRREQPYVSVNAAAIPEGVAESQLFGHVQGAFSGASLAHKGFFEQAHRGTLFLDEVGELSLSMQARLLRVLETWQVRRVGDEQVRRVDVRLVCATHRDLKREVKMGRFRADLLFRLAHLRIDVPPLRERMEEVTVLVRHFLSELAPKVGPRGIEPAAMRLLREQSYPGNVRELRQLVCAAVARCSGPLLTVEDVRGSLGIEPIGLSAADAQVLEVLAEHGGNVSAAARILGMPRSTLRDRVRVLGRKRPEAVEDASGRGRRSLADEVSEQTLNLAGPKQVI